MISSQLTRTCSKSAMETLEKGVAMHFVVGFKKVNVSRVTTLLITKPPERSELIGYNQLIAQISYKMVYNINKKGLILTKRIIMCSKPNILCGCQ